MQSYARRELEDKVAQFINEVGSGKGIKERPNIKFTLRVTSRMERYLDWKSKKLKKTKADFLREFIGEIMDKDEGFRGK